jgi:uncharacterized protein YaiE (UPF0345 family)
MVGRVGIGRLAPLIVLVAVYVVAYRFVLFAPYLIVGVDFPIPSSSLDNYLYGLTSTWSPFNMGSPSIWSYSSLFIAFIVFISGGCQLLAQKLLFIHPLMASFSMYYFISRNISGSRIIALVCSVIYAYGPPTSYNYGWIFFGWSMVLIPLMLNSLLNMVRSRCLRDAVIFSILLSILLSFSLHYAVFLLLLTLLIAFLGMVYYRSLRIVILYFTSVITSLIINPSLTLTIMDLWFGADEKMYFTPRMIEFILNYRSSTFINVFTAERFVPYSLFKPLGFIFPIVAFLSLIVVKSRGLRILMLPLVLTYLALAFFYMSVMYGWPIFTWLYNSFLPLRALRGIHGPSFLVWIIISLLIPLTLAELRFRSFRLAAVICILLISSFYVYEPIYDPQALSMYANQGFTALRNPPVYGEIIEWLRRNCDGRYLAVPYIHTAWLNLPHYPHLFLPVGSGASRYAYGYAGFTSSIFVNNLTTRLESILTPVNVKYVVLLNVSEPFTFGMGGVRVVGYSLITGLIAGDAGSIDGILLSQKGLKQVLVGDSYKIYGNINNPSHILIYPLLTYAVGNRYLITRTSSIPCLNNTLLFFSEQSGRYRLEALNKSSIILFYNRDIYDLLMQFLDEYMVDLAPYGDGERLRIADVWVRATDVENRFLTPDLPSMNVRPWYGDFPYGDGFIETISDKALTLNLDVDDDGFYDVFVRTLLSPYSKAVVNISINGHVESVNPRTEGFVGFKWLRIGRLTLNRGVNRLEIAKSSGYAAIDDVAIVPDGVLNKTMRRVLGLINGKDVVFIYDGKYPLKELYIPLTNKYHIAVFSRETPILHIDDEPIKLTFGGLAYTNTITLKPNTYRVYFTGDVDEVMFSSINPSVSYNYNINYTFRKISDERYEVNVYSEKPVYIVLTEPYSEDWKAYMSGKQLPHLPAFSIVNSFHLDKGGTVTIEYKCEKYLVAKLVSIATLAILTATIIATSLRKHLNLTIIRCRQLNRKLAIKLSHNH